MNKVDKKSFYFNINVKVHKINQVSHNEVTVIDQTVRISTESTFEDVFLLDFESFGAFRYFVSNLCTVVANVVSWFVLEQVLVQNFGLCEILLNEDFRVMVWAFPSLLTVPVHVVPAELSDDVFVLAGLSQNAEPHVVVGAAFVHVSKLAMVAFRTHVFHKLLADFDIVTEVALIAVRAAAHVFKLITGFDLTSVMRVRTSLTAFSVDEFFANVIFCQFMWIRCNGLVLIEVASVVEFIIHTRALPVVVEWLL